MATYLRVLAVIVLLFGLAGSGLCWQGARGDAAYYKALRGAQRYPQNVLYKTELKMAEPRHFLLLAGAAGSAPAGIVVASMLGALASLLARPRRGP